jgi:hypothetical protein
MQMKGLKMPQFMDGKMPFAAVAMSLSIGIPFFLTLFSFTLYS